MRIVRERIDLILVQVVVRSCGMTWIVFGALLAATACHRDPMASAPPAVLVAEDRLERLRFVDPRRFGIAAARGSVTLRGDRVETVPRRAPLYFPPARTWVAGVVRIQAVETMCPVSQIEAAAAAVVELQNRDTISALLLDFDPPPQLRDCFRGLVRTIRKRLPASRPLAILARPESCSTDPWMSGLPVQEVIPKGRGEFSEPLCSWSRALESGQAGDAGKRVYWFSPEPWTEGLVERLRAY